MAIVCVVGMHRSGTSYLAGSLQEAGLYAGDVSRGDPYNRRGNREHAAIRALNDDVLQASGADWSRPPERVVWDEQHEWRRDRLISEFGASAPHWTFKDPRTLLVLSFWRAARSEIVFVGIFRHPVLVARSLGARGAMSLSPEQGLRLWIVHNRRLLDLLRREPFPLLCFDAPPAQLGDALASSVEWLNHRLRPEAPWRPAAASAFYEKALVHQTDADPEALLSASEAPMQGTALLREAQRLYDDLRARSASDRPSVPCDA